MRLATLCRTLLTIVIPLAYLPPLLLTANALPIPSTTINYLTYLGLISILAGLFLWVTAYINLGRSFQVLPQASHLVTSGPYRYCRHPIYLGILLTMLGLALTTKSLPALLYILYFLIPLTYWRAHYENHLLSKKFTTTYSQYRRSTLF